MSVDSKPMNGETALAQIWAYSSLDPSALARAQLKDETMLLPSSFLTNTAAQASIAAAALAAENLYFARTGTHQTVSVESQAAERECTGYFTYNGTMPNAWEKFSGLYPSSDGHVRIHANFAHHRDGVLDLLKLPDADHAEREDVANALSKWTAEEFETAAAERGLVVSMARTLDQWDEHTHRSATKDLPLLTIEKIGDATPRRLDPINQSKPPLTGLKILDLTRILAGPTCGKTLAAYGADVMLVNSPNLPNIDAIIDTSRGKRSTYIDLGMSKGRAALHALLNDTHIFVQGYRPEALAGLGFSPAQLADQYPGIIYVSLSAYGPQGPWSSRRGFDSLVQTATGLNWAEADAAGVDVPKALPLPILDYVSGFLMAYGAQIAQFRQLQEGGSWHVQVSLLQTSYWLRNLGRTKYDSGLPRANLKPYLHDYACDHGTLAAIPHAAEFSMTPPHWRSPSVMPGTHKPVWTE